MSDSYQPEYEKLNQLLASADWKAADEETTKLTFQIDLTKLRNRKDIEARKEVSASIDKFPIEDLRQIDNLWMTYSSGHFGLDVQWKILKKILAELEQNPQVSI